MYLLSLAVSGLIAGAALIRTDKGFDARELQIVASYRDAVLDSLNRWIDDRSVELRGIAMEIEFSYADDKGPGGIAKRFIALTSGDSHYADMFLVAPDGRLYVGAQSREVIGPLASYQAGIDLSDRAYVRLSLNGEPSVSGMLTYRFSGHPSFAISQPVSVGGQTWALVGIVSLERFTGIVNALNLDELGDAMLLDPRGLVVSSPDYTASFIAPDAEVDAFRLEGQALERIGLGTHGADNYRNHAGVWVAGAWGAIPRLDLNLLVELNAERSDRPLREIRRFVVLILLLTGLIAGVAAYLLSVNLVRPTSELIGAVRGLRDDSFRSSIALRTKTEFDELIAAFNEMAEAVRFRQESLKSSAERDGLTGLLNRRALDDRLDKALRGGRRREGLICFVMIDIDFFKRVNDDHGHQVGDEALRGVACLVAGSLRGDDIVARYGGEEFAAILSVRDAAEAERLCERIRGAVEAHPFLCYGRSLSLTVSIGFACLGAESLDATGLIRLADEALYAVKNSGRNAVRGGGILGLPRVGL